MAAASDFWQQFVEAGGVDVGGERDRPFLVGGVDDPEELFGGVGGDQGSPTASITIRSARVRFEIALVTLSSGRWRHSRSSSNVPPSGTLRIVRSFAGLSPSSTLEPRT